MKAKAVAELVCLWARDRNVGDLDVFCSSLRTWGHDLEPLTVDEARDIAMHVPYTPDVIYGAFCPIVERPTMSVRDDAIRPIGDILLEPFLSSYERARKKEGER